jgi:Double zinc ribbon
MEAGEWSYNSGKLSTNRERLFCPRQRNGPEGFLAAYLWRESSYINGLLRKQCISVAGRRQVSRELMLCTFCGTENGPENKFCGMCGVRLERRKAERRARHDSLKCQSCGHTNEQDQKYCGMCGSRVDRRTQDRRASSPGQFRATAMANAQLPTPEAIVRKSQPLPAAVDTVPPTETLVAPVSEVPPHPRTPPAIFRDQPTRTTIVGHSFLGLSDEPEGEGQYLLEDEGSSGGVLRKLVLIVTLAAVGGLIFVGWRSGFLANSKLLQPPKPQPTASPLPQSKTQVPAPVADGSQENSAGNGSPDQSPAAARRSDSEEAQPTDSKSASAAGGAGQKPFDAVTEKPIPARQKASEEMPASSRKPSDTLVQAQNYLQGRGGVRQNCEQGLIYLRAATQKNEPAADVQMGALYASGHCVQQDRVTAYRWFNSAHELDPANPWIRTNLDQLWAQMTPQERQRTGQ